MRYLFSIAIWTASLSAATATARIVAFLSGVDPLAQILRVAEGAALAGLALLLAAFAVRLLTRRRLKPAPWGTPGHLPAADWVSCFHQRREVLDQRLKIDEPHLCSQHLIACTCWSFCAGSNANAAAAGDTAPASECIIRVRKLLPQTRALPLVHRIGMDSCPFRFASPFSRRAPAYAVVLNSIESGAAAH